MGSQFDMGINKAVPSRNKTKKNGSTDSDVWLSALPLLVSIDN